MFVARYIHIRPALNVPFFPSSSRAAAGENATVQALVNAAPGFVSQIDLMSEDLLTNTVDVAWADKTSFLNFEAVNHDALRDYRENRLAYEVQVEGSTMIEFFHTA